MAPSTNAMCARTMMGQRVAAIGRATQETGILLAGEKPG